MSVTREWLRTFCGSSTSRDTSSVLASANSLAIEPHSMTRLSRSTDRSGRRACRDDGNTSAERAALFGDGSDRPAGVGCSGVVDARLSRRGIFADSHDGNHSCHRIGSAMASPHKTRSSSTANTQLITGIGMLTLSQRCQRSRWPPSSIYVCIVGAERAERLSG